MLVRYHVRDVWDSKYGVAYCVVCMLGLQLELKDESSKICMFNTSRSQTQPINQ